MSEFGIPHLCGGILYGLLLEAIKPRTKAKDKLKGGTDGLSNPDVYAGFITLVVGGDDYYGASTLEKCASDYKKCVSSKGGYVPFTKQSTISGFDSSVKTKNPDLLRRMTEFTDRFLNRVKCEWLVRALIETIQKDPGIDQDKTEIAVNYSEKTKASKLHEVRNIEFYPFMISVINFVLHYSPDAESGRPTFERWYKQKGGAKTEWVLKEPLGKDIAPVILSFEQPPASVLEGGLEPLETESAVEDEIDIEDDLNTIAGNLSKPLEILAEALKANTHQIAERIRENNKKTDSPDDEPEEEYAEVIDDKETDSSNDCRLVPESKTEKVPAQENKEIAETPKNESESLYAQFKKDSFDIIAYCINTDIAAAPVKLSLADEIDGLVENWHLKVWKIDSIDEKRLVVDTLNVLSEFQTYLTDNYLRYNPNTGTLIFRNSSIEEGDRLRDELRPESIRLRKELAELFKKLWSVQNFDKAETAKAEDIDNEKASGAAEEDKKIAVIQQQTNVIQNGDNNVNLTNNGTINFNF